MANEIIKKLEKLAEKTGEQFSLPTKTAKTLAKVQEAARKVSIEIKRERGELIPGE